METVAVIGSGFIGRGWAVCFARAGNPVRLWDPAAGAAAAAHDYIAAMLPDLAERGLLSAAQPDDVIARITIAASLEAAVAHAAHIQENAPEDLDLKRRLMAELDAAAPANAIIASSTSALLPSHFTADVAGRARCIVAHPVNPPHLVPLVELVPAPWTSPDTIARTEALMRQIGQSPVRLEREIDGFLLNRLQAALLDEAFRLVDGGFAKAEAVDACMRDGLAPRWSFMGPFETIDLNAPGGVRDYVERYHQMFAAITGSMRHSADWSGPVLDRIEAERRSQVPRDRLQERQMWRDRKLMDLARSRQTQN